MADRPLVTVVDDDESVRESLPDLLRVLGYDARSFSSGKAFLSSLDIKATRCLILDIAMPGMSGPQLAAELRRRGNGIPIVYITAHRDEALRTRLLAQGAVACLFKPFSDTSIAGAIETAIRT